MTSDLQNKSCYLIPTLLDFQILVKKCLPFATLVILFVKLLFFGLVNFDSVYFSNFPHGKALSVGAIYKPTYQMVDLEVI